MFGSSKFNRLIPHPGYNDPFTAVLGIAAIVGGAKSYQQQKKSAKAQRQAGEAQARGAAVEAQKSRIAQVREERIRAAQIRAQAGATGMGQASSGVAGSIASIGSQTAANIGAINVQQGFAEEASAQLQTAANAQLSAAGWQTISSIAGAGFGAKGGWTKVFGGNTPKAAGK